MTLNIIAVIFVNIMMTFLCKSFGSDVFGWWRPWASIILLIPPLGIVIGLLIIVISLIAIGLSELWIFLKNKFSDLFVRCPPKEK